MLLLIKQQREFEGILLLGGVRKRPFWWLCISKVHLISTPPSLPPPSRSRSVICSKDWWERVYTSHSHVCEGFMAQKKRPSEIQFLQLCVSRLFYTNSEAVRNAVLWQINSVFTRAVKSLCISSAREWWMGRCGSDTDARWGGASEIPPDDVDAM